MAAVAHFFTYNRDFGLAGIRPGESRWVSFGPSDVFKNAAVIITVDPGTVVTGASFHRAIALQVTDTFVHEYPTVLSGGFVVTGTHVDT